MSLLNPPDWASRHNYFWHSNPRSKPRDKTFYDKVYCRPLLERAWTAFRDKESDAQIKSSAWETIQLFDSKHNGQDNVNMLSGRLVQQAADLVLIDGKDPSSSINETLIHFNAYKPRVWDDEVDLKKHEYFKDEFEKVTEHAIAGLREAMHQENRIIGEIELIKELPGVELPHNTRPDYARRGDLKTKWPKLSKVSKSGFASSSVSGTLSSNDFNDSALYQVAGFWALNGHLPPFIVYANSKDYKVFTPENTPELRDEYLEEIVQDIIRYHRTTERMLKSSETMDELLEYVNPNFKSFYWNEPPAFLSRAKEIWKVK
jgi:hypothetical protein|tara:strand:+ start:108 stop:1058 length:951 start_codon:yes stop_codon:yes gene_type:complete